MASDVRQIDYGMFIMPFHDPAKPLAQCYDEDLELIVRAEELGFNEFWIGEHHTMKYENIVMPEIFIARALGETSRIRLGPAPVCLNQHHPAHVASRLAFLDHLSKGRLNLCFGTGSVTADQELYRRRAEERRRDGDRGDRHDPRALVARTALREQGQVLEVRAEEDRSIRRAGSATSTSRSSSRTRRSPCPA